MSTEFPEPEKQPEQQAPVPSDRQAFCEHRFFAISSNPQSLVEGGEVWFNCDQCLLTVKRTLKDQSDKL